MRLSHRAAAFAAAALGLFAAVGLAAPSFATEGETTIGISYIDHAVTAVPIADLNMDDFNAPAQPALPAELETPIAVHALAPALPAPESPAASPSDERNGRSLAELVGDFSSASTTDSETDCLARAVYFESKGEPLAGQLTVAEVIINRAESGRFPSSICGVVRQPSQFSFVRRGHIPTPPSSARDWRIAVAIAEIAMRDLAEGSAPRALFFHARHASPGWRLTRVATVGNHIFYR